ncbi:hypothetical protein V8C86DRAFT_2755777 [Haematococcus lacustris]
MRLSCSMPCSVQGQGAGAGPAHTASSSHSGQLVTGSSMPKLASHADGEFNSCKSPTPSPPLLQLPLLLPGAADPQSSTRLPLLLRRGLPTGWEAAKACRRTSWVCTSGLKVGGGGSGPRSPSLDSLDAMLPRLVPPDTAPVKPSVAMSSALMASRSSASHSWCWALALVLACPDPSSSTNCTQPERADQRRTTQGAVPLRWATLASRALMRAGVSGGRSSTR